MTMQIEELEKMKSPSQAAGLLRVTETRVYQLLDQKRLKAIKLGRQWYIDPDSLQEFASKDRQAGNPNFKKTA